MQKNTIHTLTHQLRPLLGVRVTPVGVSGWLVHSKEHGEKGAFVAEAELSPPCQLTVTACAPNNPKAVEHR